MFTHSSLHRCLARSRVLVALGGCLAALGFAALAPTTALASPANSFPNSRIAQIAQSYPNGAYGGQCYVFVYNVLLAASNGRVRIGGADTYYGAYARAGGVLVSPQQATTGDIIQISVPSSDDNYYPGMHTAIIVKNLGGGEYDVVDSNWGWTQQIHHHVLNPYSLLVPGSGESVQFWRMGQVSPSSGAVTVSPPSGPNTFQVYGTGGDTLNIRSGPGRQYAVVGSLPDGQAVAITCQTRGGVVMGSSVWDEIGPGEFVSDWYIDTPVVNEFTPGLPHC